MAQGPRAEESCGMQKDSRCFALASNCAVLGTVDSGAMVRQAVLFDSSLDSQFGASELTAGTQLPQGSSSATPPGWPWSAPPSKGDFSALALVDSASGGGTRIPASRSTAVRRRS